MTTDEKVEKLAKAVLMLVESLDRGGSPVSALVDRSKLSQVMSDLRQIIAAE
jgi:hypothetical protein